MIDINGSRTGRIADATFDQNVFGEDPTVKRLETELSEARTDVSRRKRAIILKEFRDAVAEFDQQFGGTPSLVLLSYNDLHYLIHAYNMEGLRMEPSRPDVETTGDDSHVFIDAIKCRQGCDQTSGKIKLYQLE
jgi:hypothetical protein